MALWVRKGLCRVSSSISSCEPTIINYVRTLSTKVLMEASSDKDKLDNLQEKIMYKKTSAMLIGYRGADYYGVCLNPGQDNIPTVGKDIIKALVKAGYTDESYLSSAKSMSQASRTDRGVSALRQVITMSLGEDVDLDKVRPYLNDNIKLYGMIHTIRRFVPFRFCEGRSYLYYIPSYVFSPQSLEMNPGYRLTSDISDKIKRLLGKFLGKKNYHNFTRGRSFHDQRAIRDISKIEFLEPVVKDGFELACIRLQGKSFILNQIRKIIGALVTVVRGYGPESLIDIALSQQGLTIGRAPPHGLMLEHLDFGWYNNKFRHQGFEPVDFSKYEQEVEELKDKILSGVIATEIKYERTKLWVETLQYMPLEPFNKEQFALDSSLEYDETLNIVRSEKTSVCGNQAASVFI